MCEQPVSLGYRVGRFERVRMDMLRNDASGICQGSGEGLHDGMFQSLCGCVLYYNLEFSRKQRLIRDT